MNAGAIGEERKAPHGPEGSSPGGAFPPWVGLKTALILLPTAPQPDVLLPQDHVLQEINVAVDSVKLTLCLRVAIED